MDARLASKCRLQNATQYQNVMYNAQPTTTTMFRIFAKDTNQPNARLGLAVSAKSVKTAVMRNQIKRQIKETFRLHQTTLPKKDFVILYRGTSKPPLQDVRRQLINVWETAVSNG